MEMKDIEGTAYTLIAYSKALRCKVRLVIWQMPNGKMKMGKGSGSDVGTGGMATKLSAAKIANASGADMIIANGDDFHVIHRLLDGRNIGTLFVGHLDENFDLVDVLEEDR